MRAPLNLDPQHLNTAFDELMTWGPRLGMPLIPRIQERIPGLSEAAARELERECQMVQGLTNDLCEKLYVHELSETQVRAAVLERFAWVNEENLRHAISQGMYYAWHG